MPDEKIRIDKWLWHARFYKTRTLAAKIVSGGTVRVNGSHVKKPSAQIGAGDTLTFVKEKDVRVIRVEALGARRGPAEEAQTLYEDLAPPVPKTRDDSQRHPEADIYGRPTKKLRRDLSKLKEQGS